MYPDDGLRLQVLGPLRVWRGGEELDAGPRQQARLLALFLAREGRPISTSELIDQMWEAEAPRSAHNVIHKYVGSLRRLLQPALPARSTGDYLLRRGDGYMFTAPAETLDVVAFRELVEGARAAFLESRLVSAFERYVRALGLWSGSAGEGCDFGATTLAPFVRLNDAFFDTCIIATELSLSLDRPDEVLPALRLAASMAPLHEPVHASLISALGGAGQQAEALAVFRTVRTRLLEELGIDPGQLLEAACRGVLVQTLTPVREQLQPEEALPEPVRALEHATAAVGTLVGRDEELEVLRQAVWPAFVGGTAVVLVEGEPGVGKSRLLEEVASGLAGRDALVVWGRCHEGDGAPSMWPWVQVVEDVLAQSGNREVLLGGELAQLLAPQADGLTAGGIPDTSAQFRLFESVVAVVGEVSSQRPVVLVIDDLHWADVASLNLFSHLARHLPESTVVVGALRDRAPAPSSELARTLAATSRIAGHRRIRLGPLALEAVTELVRRESGSDPSIVTARNIYDRTAGNPFFVRELSRLLADGGALGGQSAGRMGVPSTVHDVVRVRVEGLDSGTVDLLQIAALIGRDVEIALLANVAGLDIQRCLDRLEPMDDLDLLEPTHEDPFSVQFAHDLVRESVVETMPLRRANQIHLRIADTLEANDPGDESVIERLAHHLWAAGPLAEPSRTVRSLVRAGGLAASKFAFEASARHLQSAAHVARTAGLSDLELLALSQLTAVSGMQSMYGVSALEVFERAERLARDVGLEVEAAGFLFSRWAALAQGIELDRSGPLARQLLDQGIASFDPIIRAYGMSAWGIHQWDIGNVGEAVRYLRLSEESMASSAVRGQVDPVHRDLRLLMTGLLAETTALHGDDAAATVLLGEIKRAGDDPYAVTVWATIAVRIAVMRGDVPAALCASQIGIATDPGFSFVFLGTYQRLAHCWAQALAGVQPATAIAEAQRILETNLLHPPRSCVALWYGLIAEMQLAAGATEEASAALDQADGCLDAYGQRYPEGLLLLLRAQVLQARGEPVTAVRAAAETARAHAAECGAHLFARRAECFLSELDMP